MPDIWPLILATLGLILVGKPLVALLVVLALGRPLRQAVGVAVALAQIGEFSFILTALGTSYGVLPPEATNAVIAASILSITLNPLLYQRIPVLLKWLGRHGIGNSPVAPLEGENTVPEVPADRQRIVVADYGPTGRNLTRILRENNIDVVLVEMNIDTVRTLRKTGEQAIHGDATQPEVLNHAGLADADALIISSSAMSARDVLSAARTVHPGIRVLIHAAYLREARDLHKDTSVAVFSGEGEVTLAMSVYLMREFGATEEQVEQERRRIRAELNTLLSETTDAPAA